MGAGTFGRPFAVAPQKVVLSEIPGDINSYMLTGAVFQFALPALVVKAHVLWDRGRLGWSGTSGLRQTRGTSTY